MTYKQVRKTIKSMEKIERLCLKRLFDIFGLSCLEQAVSALKKLENSIEILAQMPIDDITPDFLKGTGKSKLRQLYLEYSLLLRVAQALEAMSLFTEESLEWM